MVKGVECRKNASSKIFVVVIPKEELAGPMTQSYDTDYTLFIFTTWELAAAEYACIQQGHPWSFRGIHTMGVRIKACQ